MEALYKMKKSKTGQADRAMRAKLKGTASKTNRADLLDSKRRIPLSEVQPSANQMPGESGAVNEEKSTKSRLERLQEWKKRRDEVKANQRAQDKKNPPFRPCGGKKTAVATNYTHHSPAKKPVPATKKVTALKPTHDTTSVRKTVKNKTSAAAPPPRSSARLAAKHQAVTNIIRDTVKTREPLTRPVSKNNSNAGNYAKASAKPPSNRNQPGGNAARNAKSTTSKAVAPVSRKATANVQKNTSEKRTARSATSKPPSTKKSEVIEKKSISASKSQKKDTRGKNSRKPGPSVDAEESGERIYKQAEPPTPTKHSYVPVHPSPLLKRQIAPIRRETVYVPQFVSDPAWIPEALQDTASLNSFGPEPNFEEAFKTTSFSPFHFSAASCVQDNSFSPERQQGSQFVFRPVSKFNCDDIASSSSTSEMDSSDNASTQDVAKPPASKRRRNSRRCSMRLELVAPQKLLVESSSEGESSHSGSTQTPDATYSGCMDSCSSSHEVESSDVGMNHKQLSSPAPKRRRHSKRRSRRSIKATPPMMADSLESESESGSGASDDRCTLLTESLDNEAKSGGEDAVDFTYFRGLHEEVTEKFTKLCQEWEEKSKMLVEEYGNGGTAEGDINVEDVLGQIRTTVCQAQLLMRKKLKQYMSLVDQAQDPSVEKRANADDLQSFWDMVYFQVEDVQKKFDSIKVLENNGWKEKPPTPAKKGSKRRKAGAKKVGPTGSSPESNERLQAARDKRAAQRSRLREMKLAAKRAREQESELVEETSVEDPLCTVPSPKKSRVARTPQGSSTGRERRRSQRLISRSVFSPIASTKAGSCVTDVPTGCLISFSPLV